MPQALEFFSFAPSLTHLKRAFDFRIVAESDFRWRNRKSFIEVESELLETHPHSVNHLITSLMASILRRRSDANRKYSLQIGSELFVEYYNLKGLF